LLFPRLRNGLFFSRRPFHLCVPFLLSFSVFPRFFYASPQPFFGTEDSRGGLPAKVTNSSAFPLACNLQPPPSRLLCRAAIRYRFKGLHHVNDSFPLASASLVLRESRPTPPLTQLFTSPVAPDFRASYFFFPEIIAKKGILSFRFRPCPLLFFPAFFSDSSPISPPPCLRDDASVLDE